MVINVSFAIGVWVGCVYLESLQLWIAQAKPIKATQKILKNPTKEYFQWCLIMVRHKVPMYMEVLAEFPWMSVHDRHIVHMDGI